MLYMLLELNQLYFEKFRGPYWSVKRNFLRSLALFSPACKTPLPPNWSPNNALRISVNLNVRMSKKIDYDQQKWHFKLEKTLNEISNTHAFGIQFKI